MNNNTPNALVPVANCGRSDQDNNEDIFNQGASNYGVNRQAGNYGTNSRGGGNNGANSRGGRYGANRRRSGNYGTNSQARNYGANNQAGNYGANNQAGNYGANNQAGNYGANNQAGNNGANSHPGNYGANNQAGNYGANSQPGRRNSDSSDEYSNKGRFSDSSDSDDGAYAKKGGHRVRMTEVNMPTGLRITVTIPAKECECSGRCSFALRRTLLRPQGEMGRREYDIVSGQMVETIRPHAERGGGGRFTGYDIIAVEKIQNCCLWKRFRKRERQMVVETGYVNERMLFHGSKSADTIAGTGFDRSCAKPGGMFGPAIYFAEHSSKSNQYAFGTLGGKGCPNHGDKSCYVCERKVLLCRVALGRMYFEKNVNQMSHLPSNFSSVAGEPSSGGLRYPEYAVYKGDQAYPEYLITYKIVR